MGTQLLDNSWPPRVARGGHPAQAAIFSHCSAQAMQASAHRWQWSALCFLHSSPQARQTWAQTRHNSAAYSLPRAMNAAAVRQICAQSMSCWIQPAIILTSSSLMTGRRAHVANNSAIATCLDTRLEILIHGSSPLKVLIARRENAYSHP